MAQTPRAPRYSTFTRTVLELITDHDGITAKMLADLRGDTDSLYGKYHKVSASVAQLRRDGYVQDVKERCAHCYSALTRSDRNVALHATGKVML